VEERERGKLTRLRGSILLLLGLLLYSCLGKVKLEVLKNKKERRKGIQWVIR
jgi:hypothetical protein